MDNGTNKTSSITFRLQEFQKAKAEQAAAARHQKLSEFIRETIEKEIKAWEEEERKAGMK